MQFYFHRFKFLNRFCLIVVLFCVAACERNYTCHCKWVDNTEMTTVIKSDSWDKANDLCAKQLNTNDSSTCVILESQRKCY